GDIVIAPMFDEADKFYGNLAQVVVGDKIGYINKIGKFVWEPRN
ncbi:MAG: WG repeat-containing protein, partial [Nitrospirae bacterium]|nr:WG repeat-containing protein [Nitrospirota bacterium]